MVYFNASFRKVHSAHPYIIGKNRQVDLLCEKEEAVVGQTQESTAGHDYLQQVVQFSESDHLLLQIYLGAQVVTLQSTTFSQNIL